MSLKCPQCSTKIDQDFGVVQCTKCSTVLVIDMDGNIQVSHASSGTQSMSISAEDAAISVEEEAPYDEMEFSVVMDQDALVPEAIEIFEEPTSAETPLFAPPAPEGDMEIVIEAPVAEPLEEEIIEEQAIEVIDESPAAPLSPLEEIAAFGNSDLLSTPLSYTLVIEGINSKETRESLREAFREPKFNWNVAEMMSRVKNGRLEIRKVDPAKASVLIRKLQDLPIKVSWRQHAFEN